MNDNPGSQADPALQRTVRLVALLNLGYFGVEFAVALRIGSVSLFADSVDFLEDASVNLLILVALAWTARNRARTGMVLAAILLIPGVATLATAWEKINAPVAPVSTAPSRSPATAGTVAASPGPRFFRRATTLWPTPRSSRPA